MVANTVTTPDSIVSEDDGVWLRGNARSCIILVSLLERRGPRWVLATDDMIDNDRQCVGPTGMR
jgi:hypothetical protein